MCSVFMLSNCVSLIVRNGTQFLSCYTNLSICLFLCLWMCVLVYVYASACLCVFMCVCVSVLCVCACLCVSGVVVTQLSASDADSGSSGWLFYRLDSGAQDRFIVDSLSGTVLVGNATLDREERSSYRLVVIATDRGTPSLSGTATLSVVLDDVNDSRPRFLEPVTNINVNESTPPGMVVATLTATDPDLRPRLEYYIISVEAKDDGNNPVGGLQESFGIDFHTGE